MIKNYRLLLSMLLSAFLFAVSGCSKDDDLQTMTRTEMLTSGSWVLTSFSVNPPLDLDGDEVPDTDLLGLLPPCSQDDITVFKSDFTYTEEEGPEKCDPDDPTVFTTGTWAFSADEKKITFNPAGSDPYTVDVQELTSTALRTTTFFTDSANTTYTFTSVYSH